MNRSFLCFFSDNSSLLDFHFFDIFSETVLNGLNDVLLVSLKGIVVSASSKFEFGVIGVLLDEDGCLGTYILLLTFAFDLSAPLGSFKRARNSLGFWISFG